MSRTLMTKAYALGAKEALEKVASGIEISKGEEMYTRILKLMLSIERKLDSKPGVKKAPKEPVSVGVRG